MKETPCVNIIHFSAFFYHNIKISNIWYTQIYLTKIRLFLAILKWLCNFIHNTDKWFTYADGYKSFITGKQIQIYFL